MREEETKRIQPQTLTGLESEAIVLHSGEQRGLLGGDDDDDDDEELSIGCVALSKKAQSCFCSNRYSRRIWEVRRRTQRILAHRRGEKTKRCPPSL